LLEFYQTMTTVQPVLPDAWLQYLQPEFDAPYMQALRQFLREEKDKQKTIYPHSKNVFNAFWLTPFDTVRVVILGQDPYHGPGQAHGLCFSVPEGILFPPSLKNIFIELQNDLGVSPSKNGDLTHWAKQGVLLLNSVLTVEASKAASHEGRGWERFTDKAIEVLNREKENLVFILWGSYAQRKGALIDRTRHLILQSVHPSPLSSYRGFFGSKPFGKTNQFLIEKGLAPIVWG